MILAEAQTQLAEIGTPCGAAGLMMGGTFEAGPIVSAEEAAFQSMLAKVDTLDFSTPPNAAIFYSGPGNYLKATSFAEQSGGANMTIEMTAGGQQLLSDPDFQSLNRDQQYEIASI